MEEATAQVQLAQIDQHMPVGDPLPKLQPLNALVLAVLVPVAVVLLTLLGRLELIADWSV